MTSDRWCVDHLSRRHQRHAVCTAPTTSTPAHAAKKRISHRLSPYQTAGQSAAIKPT